MHYFSLFYILTSLYFLLYLSSHFFLLSSLFSSQPLLSSRFSLFSSLSFIFSLSFCIFLSLNLYSLLLVLLLLQVLLLLLNYLCMNLILVKKLGKTACDYQVSICSPQLFHALQTTRQMMPFPMLYDEVHCNANDARSPRNIWDCAHKVATPGRCSKAATVACVRHNSPDLPQPRESIPTFGRLIGLKGEYNMMC